MLTRLLPCIAALAIVASPPAASTAAAAVVSPETGTIARVDLDLKASNGLEAHLETSQKEVVTLTLTRGESSVTYEVRGEVTEAGLKVRFGRLGRIDVAFTPTVTLDSTEPSPECAGQPRTLREGVFSGTIEFTGEGGYVRLEGPEASGSMSVISQWECPDNELPFKGGLPTVALRSHNFEGRSESASLHADNRRCLCFFAAGVHHRHSGGGSIFYGVKGERLEGMEITRTTAVHGGPGAFSFDHKADTATLRPPRPFTGTATYEQRSDGRKIWRSTIRVPLLGAPPLRTGGPGFRVGLYPEYYFD
jgi:hypothetical protein